MKVYLAVGHGRTPSGTHDPGAVSSNGLWNEQTAGDHVVSAAQTVLEAAGVDVMSEARDPADPNWQGSAKAANAWGADLLVAWHHDWSGSPLDQHAFWWPGNTRSEALARAIVTAGQDAGQAVSWNWVKPRDDLGLLRTTNADAVLVECGRIGGLTLDSVDELTALGRAHGRAILDHLGLKPNPPKEHDMDWLTKWPRYLREWALSAQKKGLITEHTDPNRKLSDVTWGELIVMLDRDRD